MQGYNPYELIISGLNPAIVGQSRQVKLYLNNKIQYHHLSTSRPSYPVQKIREHLLPHLCHPPKHPSNLTSQPLQCNRPTHLCTHAQHGPRRIRRLQAMEVR